MALYSWFSKNNDKPSKKSIRVRNNLLKSSESTKYIENYTMWPTAKIKPGIEVTLPVHDVVDNKLVKESNKAELEDEHMPLDAPLIVTK